MPVSTRAVAGKLPAEATSFVGRRKLLAEVKAAFASTRLLTLVGPGGVGKTRLALRAGADLQRTVRDGVWFIDLAGLEDPHLVAKAVISNLGVADQSGKWPTSLLISHLASREALLILDNCEHLLDAVAVLADVVLKEAAGVRLLATSRQALGISGERVVQVPPLTLQGEPGADTGQGAAHSEAVALLVARATDAGVQLEETAATRQLLLDVCRRLDGMPLALELAAVRLRTIGLDQLLERLSDRFALLTGGSRAALPRQQTLRATIDWSHGSIERFRRRYCCAGSRCSRLTWDLMPSKPWQRRWALTEVRCSSMLSSLIEKSFVTRLGPAANARYKLHETMREYALIKLREAEEEPAAITAFVGFYADMCQRAEKAAQSPELVDWLKCMDLEADNVRAALAHCLHGPNHAMGVSMVASLLWYWTARATSEGAYWLDLYLENREADDTDDAAIARALFSRGFVSMVLGDAATAVPALDEAEAKARAGRDSPLLARILSVSAGIRVMSGELEGARSQLREAKTLAQGFDDPGVDAMLALTEGFIALGAADVDTVGRVYAEWSPRARDRGDLQTLSYLLSSYGFSLLQQDRPDQAGPLLQESLGIERRLENRDMILYAARRTGQSCVRWSAGCRGLRGCSVPRRTCRPKLASA